MESVLIIQGKKDASCNWLDNYAVPTVPLRTSLVSVPLSQLKRSSAFRSESRLWGGHGDPLLQRRNIRAHAAKMPPPASKSTPPTQGSVHIAHFSWEKASGQLTQLRLDVFLLGGGTQPRGFVLGAHNPPPAFGSSCLGGVKGSTVWKEGKFGLFVRTALSSKSQVVLENNSLWPARHKSVNAEKTTSANVCVVEAHVGWQSS